MPLKFVLHCESDPSLHASAQSFTLNQPACCIVVSSRKKQGFNSHTVMVQIPSHKVLVVHDDLDLPTGKVRLRARGGHGGHNGMRSITQHLKGSQDFPRLKIGIGRPAGQLPVASFVLQVGFSSLPDLPIQINTVSVAVVSLAGLIYFLLYCSPVIARVMSELSSTAWCKICNFIIPSKFCLSSAYPRVWYSELHQLSTIKMHKSLTQFSCLLLIYLASIFVM